ncbi:hypothetical protein CR983_02905 [Candidatus Saccharibacteria bacterium]|nr:MAG: hypothetical protein CR983_02905 [Candidatus Saccharibacteria bacterium]
MEDTFYQKFKHVGFAFIKPGFEDVHDPLVNDFEEHGLSLVYEKHLVLPEPAFEYIYRDALDKHFYEDMKHYLGNHAVTAMLLSHDTENAQSLLHDLKSGGNGRPNLRDKYRQKNKPWITDDEINLWNNGIHPDQYGTTVALTQENVFHAADDTKDALLTLKTIKEKEGHFITPGDIKEYQLGWLASLVDLEEIMDSIRKQIKSRSWKSADHINEEDRELPINQVYVWIISSDGKIAVVSKDGKKWQLPGGKPIAGETPIETASREVFEETGVSINPEETPYKFFGYYDIVESDKYGQNDRYLQVRYSVCLHEPSDLIALDPSNEDEEQMEAEQIQFADFVSPSELVRRIPWARESLEMQQAYLSIRS